MPNVAAESVALQQRQRAQLRDVTRRGEVRLHHVEVSAGVRSLCHKRYFFKEKRKAGFVDDCVAKNDCVGNGVHLGGDRQRLADCEAIVSARNTG